MNTQEVKKLLEKYYNGDSSEDEELALKEFFASDNIVEGFEEDKVIFNHFTELAKIPHPSPGFEKRIISALDLIRTGPGIFNFREKILPYLGVAAGLLILTGSYFFLIRESRPQETFTDPDLAYAETVKILYEVSSQLNRGTQALDPVRKFEDVTVKSFSAINKSAAIIDENLKNFDYFRKALNIVGAPMDISKHK